MKVAFQKDKKPELEADLSVVGNCFMLILRKRKSKHIIRIGPMTKIKWALIAARAKDQAHE